MTPNRQDTLRDKIATVIQEGHVAKKTSDEIAGDVLKAVIAEPPTDAFRTLVEFHD